MFVTFEGVEGVGKSTQAKLLADRIRSELRREVVLTREPGGTQLAENLRSMVLDSRGEPIDGRTEALIMAAARAHHVSQLIEPSMRAEKFVVCDRFAGSFLAYQGYGRGLDLELLRAITHFASNAIEPDISFHLYLDTEQAFSRVARHKDRIEAEDIEFFQRVEEGFSHLAISNSWVSIDASLSIDDVHEQVFASVLQLSQDFGEK